MTVGELQTMTDFDVLGALWPLILLAGLIVAAILNRIAAFIRRK